MNPAACPHGKQSENAEKCLHSVAAAGMIRIRKRPLIQTNPAEFTGMRAMYGRVFHFFRRIPIRTILFEIRPLKGTEQL